MVVGPAHPWPSHRDRMSTVDDCNDDSMTGSITIVLDSKLDTVLSNAVGENTTSRERVPSNTSRPNWQGFGSLVERTANWTSKLVSLNSTLCERSIVEIRPGPAVEFSHSLTPARKSSGGVIPPSCLSV